MYYGVHHKNDRRTAPITYTLPEGPLKDFMLLHISQGHKILRDASQERQPCLFMTSKGASFMSFKAALNYAWEKITGAKWCPGLPQWTVPFAPSKGRTIYVEHITSATGYAPDEWEGPARAMGNSTKQWALHYAPTMHDRLVQDAVNKHHVFRADGASTSQVPVSIVMPNVVIDQGMHMPVHAPMHAPVHASMHAPIVCMSEPAAHADPVIPIMQPSQPMNGPDRECVDVLMCDGDEPVHAPRVPAPPSEHRECMNEVIDLCMAEDEAPGGSDGDDVIIVSDDDREGERAGASGKGQGFVGPSTEPPCVVDLTMDDF